MIWPQILAAFAALQSEPLPQQQPITLEEARSLAPAELATRLLGQTGTLYSEVSIQPWPRSLGDVVEIAFATPPRPAGSPGLCRSDIAWIHFRPAAPVDGENPPRAWVIASLQTLTDFKMVGPAGDPNAVPEAAQLDALCAQAGPIIPNVWDPSVPRRFFGSLNRPSEVAFAVRVLRQAARERADGTLADVSCHESYRIAGSCADSLATLAMLSPDLLSEVAIERCETSAGQCVDARYLPPPGWPRGLRVLEVRLQTDARLPDPDAADIRILSVDINNFTDFP